MKTSHHKPLLRLLLTETPSFSQYKLVCNIFIHMFYRIWKLPKLNFSMLVTFFSHFASCLNYCPLQYFTMFFCCHIHILKFGYLFTCSHCFHILNPQYLTYFESLFPTLSLYSCVFCFYFYSLHSGNYHPLTVFFHFFNKL